jgi:DNA excision repair protein ERCC-8
VFAMIYTFQSGSKAKVQYSMVSGGADPSIHLWDLEGRGSELDYVHRSIASINKSELSWLC